MIRVAVKKGLLGEAGVDWHEVEHRPGVRLRHLRERLVGLAPVEVVAAVDGKPLDDDDELRDGTTVVVVARTAETVLGYLVYAIISAIVSLAINYVLSVLFPTPRPPGLGQDRGDDSSPTYAWDGIATSYGQGQPIAVVLGRHAVGGQVIFSRVVPSFSGQGGTEALIIVLALCEGPIMRIGNYAKSTTAIGQLTSPTVPPTWPPLQSGLYINENLQDSSGTVIPDVVAYLRLGRLSQSPLPSNVFPGASTLYTVGDTLNDAGDVSIWTYSDTDAIDGVMLVLRAPGGIYQIGAGGTVTPSVVQFVASWRYVGETSWRQFFPFSNFSGGGGTLAPGFSFGASLTFAPTSIEGPIQVRVERLTAQGATGTLVNGCLLSSIELRRPQEFAYPGTALIGLVLQSNATFSGALPQLRQVVDGRLVRVWDESNGFSAPIWDAPPSGVFAFATQVGRNPAWLLGEFLTNTRWGLGNEIGDERVDWPQLRRWAAYCQTIPDGGWSDPRYLCDLVLDSQRPAWETVVRICWAGGAAPLWKGGKVSVVYQFRDAHTDGGVTVPAKAPVQLINSALCDDVTVRWLPLAGRATSIDFQYLDEDQGYAQNVLPVEDVESNVQDPSDPRSEPFNSQVVQAYGVTRKTQLARMGMRMHRTARLVRRELTFSCGPWLLAAEVGDLIDFQHDILRPFGDVTATVVQIVEDVTASNLVTVDRDLTALALPFVLAIRDDEGEPIYREVVAVEESLQEIYGTSCSTVEIAGDPITVSKGRSGLIGQADQLVETYQVVAITLAENVRRQVRCLQWVPEVFDPVDANLPEEGESIPDVVEATGDDALDLTPLATDVAMVTTVDGRQQVSWNAPSGADSSSASNTGGRARVFMRQAGASGPWVLLGETTGTTLELVTPSAWLDVELAVALEDADGNFTAPASSATATTAVPEFPGNLLPAPAAATQLQLLAGNCLVVTWSPVQSADVVGYEIRAGEHWSNGVTLWRGVGARAELTPAPACGVLQLAAVHASGLHGRRTRLERTVAELPYLGAAIIDTTEEAPTASGSGTHDGTQFTTDVVELDASSYVGTFTTAEADLGFEAAFFLRVALEVRHQDNATVADLYSIPAGSGEAFWRTVDARPASPQRPGINWRLTVADVADVPVEQLPDLLASGLQRGEAGAHVDAFLESRTYTGGAWSEWEPHRDRTALCSKWQARVQLGRTSLGRSVHLTALRLEALL